MAEREASGSNIKQSRTTIEGENQLIGVVLWFTVFPEIVIQRETGMIKAHPDRSVLGWFARVDTDIGEFMFWVHPLYSLNLAGRTHRSQNAALGSEHQCLEKVKFIETATSMLLRVPKSKVFSCVAFIGAFLKGYKSEYKIILSETFVGHEKQKTWRTEIDD